MSLNASLTRRVSERSESMSGARFPARGSRPRPAKAGAASAAAEPFKSYVISGRRSAFARAIFQASYGETRRSLGVGGTKPARPLLTRQRRQRVPLSLLTLAAPSIQYLFHSPADTFASITSPQTACEQAIVGRVDVPHVRADSRHSCPRCSNRSRRDITSPRLNRRECLHAFSE